MGERSNSSARSKVASSLLHPILLPPRSVPTAPTNTTKTAASEPRSSVGTPGFLRDKHRDWGGFFEEYWEKGGAVVERVGGRVPGYRYAAAFLSSLRANLLISSQYEFRDLDTSYPGSPDILPLSPTTANQKMVATRSNDVVVTTEPRPDGVEDPIKAKLAEIPPLIYRPAASRNEKVDALKLIADSIAQQRQISAYTIFTHPYLVALYILAAAVVFDWGYRPNKNLALFVTTMTGIMMTVLIAIRGYTSGFINLAETVGWEWLDEEGGSEVEVCVFGEDVIGACVFRIVTVEAKKGEKSAAKGKAKRGEIRAWTIRRRERGRGVGTGLLEEVARVCRERGAEGVTMEEGNLYEKRVIPPMFNKVLAKRVGRSKEVLERVVAEIDGSGEGKKKR